MRAGGARCVPTRRPEGRQRQRKEWHETVRSFQQTSSSTAEARVRGEAVQYQSKYHARVRATAWQPECEVMTRLNLTAETFIA